MAITKANIVTALNEELGLNEDTSTLSNRVTRAITEALRWLSRQGRWSCLHTNTTPSVAAGDESIPWPTNFRKLDCVRLNDGSLNGKALLPLKGGFERWVTNREDQTTAQRDEPTHYVERGKKIYLDPVPDDSFTATVWFWKYHPSDLDTILFDDEFAEAIYMATVTQYLNGKRQHSRSVFYQTLAAQKAEELREDYEDRKQRKTRYRDL